MTALTDQQKEMFDNMSRKITSMLSWQDAAYVNIPWQKVINKPVRSIGEDVVIGYVEGVRNEFIVVRQRVANAHTYCIPKPDIIYYDGNSLLINTHSHFIGAKFVDVDKKVLANPPGNIGR